MSLSEFPMLESVSNVCSPELRAEIETLFEASRKLAIAVEALKGAPPLTGSWHEDKMAYAAWYNGYVHPKDKPSRALALAVIEAPAKDNTDTHHILCPADGTNLACIAVDPSSCGATPATTPAMAKGGPCCELASEPDYDAPCGCPATTAESRPDDGQMRIVAHGLEAAGFHDHADRVRRLLGWVKRLETSHCPVCWGDREFCGCAETRLRTKVREIRERQETGDPTALDDLWNLLGVAG